MAVLYAQHFAQFFDDNGNPLSGGKLYTYSAGTTTPKNTYTDSTGATPNTNPIILDAAGRATLFLSGSYKFTLKTSADVLVKETDNVTAFSSSGSSVDSITTTFTEDVVTAADSFIFADASDSNNTKRDTIQGILDLGSRGAYVYLGSVTATASSSLDFTTGINSTYDTYIFSFENILTSVAAQVYARTSSNGGSTYDSGATDYRDTSGALSADHLLLGGGGAQVTRFYGNFYLYSPSGSQNKDTYSELKYRYTAGATQTVSKADLGGSRDSASAVNAIRFYPSAGNFVSGAIRLYGVSKS